MFFLICGPKLFGVPSNIISREYRPPRNKCEVKEPFGGLQGGPENKNQGESKVYDLFSLLPPGNHFGQCCAIGRGQCSPIFANARQGSALGRSGQKQTQKAAAAVTRRMVSPDDRVITAIKEAREEWFGKTLELWEKQKEKEETVTRSTSWNCGPGCSVM